MNRDPQIVAPEKTSETVNNDRPSTSLRHVWNNPD